MSRRRWASAALGLVGALVLGGPAHAQDAEALGGYTLLARANPLQITYDSPGLLPVSPIIQVSVPESYTTLNSGPTGYSLAALAFPGPLIADLATVMAQLGPTCQSPIPLPAYPVRSEAFFPQGPTSSDTSPLPGSRQQAIADGPATRSFSAWNDGGLPGLFQIGSATGTSTTSGEGEEAVTRARSVVSGFSMLAGLIEIDSIVTEVTATSTGESGKTSGTTRVSGARIADQNVRIDENGVTIAGTPLGGIADALNALGAGLNEALVQSGISIRLHRHFENKEGGLAERIASGLVIELNYNGRTAPLFSQLLAAIPSGQLPADNFTECAPSSPQGLVNLFKETHIESFALGGATVSSNAAPSFDFSGLDDTVLPDLSQVSGGSLDAGDVGGDLGGALGSLDPGGTQAGSGVLAGSESTDLFAAGTAIPVALVLLALALFPFVGSLGERFADATLAAGSAAGTCPLDSEGGPDG